MRYGMKEAIVASNMIFDPFLMVLSLQMDAIGGKTFSAKEMLNEIGSEFVRECKLPATIKAIGLIAKTMSRQLNLEKRDVYKDIVHDLKGIATTVMGSVFLAGKYLKEKMCEDMEATCGMLSEELVAIEEASSVSKKMIISANDEIMDLIKNGDIGEEHEIGEIKISEIIRIAWKLNRTKNVRDIRLQENILPDFTVKQHGLDVIRVLTNIFSNDLDALTGEDYRDNKPFLKILAGYERENGVAVLEIVDNGIGMSPEVLGRIFDDGFTTKSGKGGNGTGLCYCKKAVESKMGGNLTVKSQLGKGTTFKIEIPLS
jgi:signal transduction histidine kinase